MGGWGNKRWCVETVYVYILYKYSLGALIIFNQNVREK